MRAAAVLLATALAGVLGGCGDQPASAAPGARPSSAPPSAAPPQSGSGADIIRPRPDNSAANRADDRNALTPMDQGSGEEDMRETASIRRALLADSTLSVDAHNIKIITNRGLVTLRGVVDSVDEHKRVNRIVQQAAGTDVFDDELKVK